jgi:hypothetical protein
MKLHLNRKCESLLLVVVLLGHSFFLPSRVQAQDKVVVTVGQPNVWSLEQAHYLLARIRERNLGISNPALTEADLDPNAINGTHLEALRTLFEAGVSYDQGMGVTNRLNRQNLEASSTRRQELLARRSSLFDQKSGLLSDLGRLTAAQSALSDSDATGDAGKQKKREIQGVQDQLTAVSSQLDNVNAELTLVGAGTTALTSPAAQAGPGSFSNGLGDRIGKAITDDFVKDAAKNPRLAASIKVDNYIQMQYELLAKQLTLLREEVGADQRLIFLELPTSIYATPGRGNEMTAQSWWKVDGYFSENRYAGQLAGLKQLAQDSYDSWKHDSSGKGTFERHRLLAQYNRQERSINDEITRTRRSFYDDKSDAIKRGNRFFKNPEDIGGGLQPNDGAASLERGDIKNLLALIQRLTAAAPDLVSQQVYSALSAGTKARLLNPCDEACRTALVVDLNSLINGPSLFVPANFKTVNLSRETYLLLTAKLSAPNLVGNGIVRLNRLLLQDAFPEAIARRRTNEARTIDLIPRQSSLNVSDINEVVKERGFKAVFSFLMGIGGSVNYQQRREQFEQFQQQEVYAAGFGKGDSIFGWTFAPMPGTKRLAPGLRTTYAVMVVPRYASTIRLSAVGVSFRVKQDQPGATFAEPETRTFDVPIPGGPSDEGFFVTRIDYPHVALNQKSVVVLRGNFSTQTGVLINGTPLTRSVGVASPWLGSERGTATATLDVGEPDTKVKGYYEVINSNEIILVFLMPKDFKGAPQLTLVSPDRARTLNDITLNVNGNSGEKLPAYLIGSAPEDPKTALAINDVQISLRRPSVAPAEAISELDADINLRVVGVKKNGTDPKIFLNATAPLKVDVLGGGLYRFTTKIPLDAEKLSVTIVQGDENSIQQIDNPAFARVNVASINYNLLDEENPDDDIVTIAIEGRRIGDLIPGVDGANPSWRSAFNQGTLILTSLNKPVVTVTLTDRWTREQFPPILVYRVAAKVKKPNKDGNGNSNNR